MEQGGEFHYFSSVPCNLSTISVHYKNLRFCLDNWATINISLYAGTNKNKGYEYDADKLYSSQKDKEKQLQLEKENQRQQLGNK